MKSKTSTPTRPKKILAVDPGFDRVGIALLTKERGNPKLIFSECFKTNKKKTGAERLSSIGKRLKKTIREWRPEALAIETLFFNTNATSAIGVAEARGVILYEADKAGLEIYEYGPQTVKVAVTGYGKAGKKEVALMVKKLLGMKGQLKILDDETDAIALGITHLATERGI
ncbi:MAG: crossover junction endodeoxyribonuclease RuvC [Minisyncoccia bacterium]